MAIEKKPQVYIWDAITRSDITELKALFAANPELINAYIPFRGGTFLHLAASKPSVEVVKYLIKIGFDINKKSNSDGHTALDNACVYGHFDIADYLLSIGATMDVSEPSRNPLFGAIIGRSVEIAKLLLEHGIDTSARYTGDSMKDMDAIAFAMERGERDIARVIAEWNAKGDAPKIEELLAEGLEIARTNNQPR